MLAPYRLAGRGLGGMDPVTHDTPTDIREQLREQLHAVIEADGRSLERIGLDAWPDLERRAAGARIRYALATGWTKPEVLDDLARSLGLRVTIGISRIASQ